MTKCLSEPKLNKVGILNARTAKAIREARAQKEVVVCKNAKDMFKKLGV